MKWLTAFRAVAQSGSIKAASRRLGLSTSTVSHHLAKLEEHLGTPLIDHRHRPLSLTAQGATYLRAVDTALTLLGDAQATIATALPHGLTELRIAIIEDFEAEIGPDITRLLAKLLPDCQFKHMTRVSHEILAMLTQGALDIGIATKPETRVPDLTEIGLLNDPFVLAVPADNTSEAHEFVEGTTGLPFLRYDNSQIIGRMIDGHLRRSRLSLDHGFELDSTASMMGIVAQGGGWAITTPSNFMRSQRFQSQVRLLPFPGKHFARRISLFVAEPRALPVAQSIATAMRSMLTRHAIAPVLRDYPWLAPRFHLLPEVTLDQ